MNEETEIDHEYTNRPICPWCGHEHTEAWEWEDNGGDNQECDECGKLFSWQRIISVDYVTKKQEAAQ